MRRLAPIALLLAAALAGCADALDGEQLRLCRRAIPALHPDATEIRETRAGPAAAGRPAVRIEYSAGERGTAATARYVTCRFGGGTFDANRLDLTTVETDQGPLGEARLLYLKRFWLADPATAIGPNPADLPQISAAPAYAAQQFVNALPLCAIYALLATAYSLIYGLVGRINLAFGQIAVIGAFGTVAAVALALALGLAHAPATLAFTLICATALAALWSGAVGQGVLAPLHARHRRGQPILVATAAVAITLDEMLRISQGARDRWMPALLGEPIPLAASGAFVVTVTQMQLAVAAVALAAAIGVLLLLLRSRFGRHWRAFADDPGAAALFGVSPHRLLAATFLLAGLLAGLAGWIVAVYYGNVGFAMGTALGLKALVAAVVGGIGSVPGAFLGGILVGLVESLWSAYFDIAMRDGVVYAILIVVFVLRPGGLLGFSGPSPREI